MASFPMLSGRLWSLALPFGRLSLGRAVSVLHSRDPRSPRRVQAGQGRLLWLWDFPGHLFCFLQVCQSYTLAERTIREDSDPALLPQTQEHKPQPKATPVWTSETVA